MTPPRRRPPSPPRMTDPRLASALSHPTRVHVLSVLNTRIASPRELAAELGEPVNNVSYHIEVLKDLDCIELEEERPVLGGRVVEHFYRAKRLQYIDDDAWNRLDMKGKWNVVMPIMRLSSKDINDAMEAGTFLDPDDNHISRTPMLVDEEGWEETKVVLAETLDRLLEIRENVEARCTIDDTAKTMAMKVQLFQFRSPDRDKDI